MNTIEELTKEQKKKIRACVRGIYRSIQIGRSRNSSSVGSCTPLQVVDGDSEPQLLGQPYLKTTFRNGAFTKTLYTPSTLHIEVGRNWKGLKP